MISVATSPFTEEWAFPCDESVIKVASTPNCSMIVAGTVGKKAYFLDRSGTAIWSPKVLDDEVWACAISADGSTITFGTASKNPARGTIFIFDIQGSVIQTIPANAPVWGLGLSSDGSILAASCWSDQLLIFSRKGNEYIPLLDKSFVNSNGLYGVWMSLDGNTCVVCGYDTGIHIVNTRTNSVRNIPGDNGYYNVAVSEDSARIFVGHRGGKFTIANLESGPEQGSRYSLTMSQRPICGISVTRNGALVACGSFDGSILLSSDEGRILWAKETQGEIWSTMLSTDGAYVCAGSGDHNIYLLRNRCTSSAFEEIQSIEDMILNMQSLSVEPIERYLNLCLSMGLVEYGADQLEHFAQKINIPRTTVNRLLKKFYELFIQANPKSRLARFRRSHLLHQERKLPDAILDCQFAAQSPEYRSTALRRSAQLFRDIGLLKASRSSFRQARELYLDWQSRQILFNLGRSFEDAGQLKKALKAYELIVSWDMGHRNAWNKLNLLTQVVAKSLPNREIERADYTGDTVSLLGPDVPRNVDQVLSGVIDARKKEIEMTKRKNNDLFQIIEELYSNPKYSAGMRRDFSQLGYDFDLFIKYDFGHPEDEIKKVLETVNLMPYIKQQSTNSKPHSLDIGSATGRYPLLLTDFGFDAFGIDIEESAIAYAQKKTGDVEWPKFINGDVQNLDRLLSDEIQFNLITCMMGTFDHIEKELQISVLTKIRKRLENTGVAIISLWDTECQHLAYLSMYDDNQKELIRRNSPTQNEMVKLMNQAGFQQIHIIPFCLLPQVIVYDLGIEKLEIEDILVACQADLAARALFPNRNGEMYLAIGHNS